jgi:hypothetical protein
LTQIDWPNGDRIARDDSSVSLSCDGGTLSMWSAGTFTETEGEHVLQLAPGQLVVIGRQQGGRLKYLDPSFVPTQLVPDSDQTVLTDNPQQDNWVSRGHFSLRGSAQGVVLVNGVPGVNGGIRPPTNWTALLEPDYRIMEKGEEFLVERGASARIQLPNGARILLRAS